MQRVAIDPILRIVMVMIVIGVAIVHVVRIDAIAVIRDRVNPLGLVVFCHAQAIRLGWTQGTRT
jgi:hypothetical protein